MSEELMRKIPGVDSWLASEPGQALVAEYSHAEVVDVMRAHLSRIRSDLRGGGDTLPDLKTEAYTNRLRAELLQRRIGSLRPVVNATGIVIHTNLGRAPLAREAIDAMSRVARGYSSLEFDLDNGQRGSRNAHVSQLLSELTGAEDALVVNNCAAAVLLVLATLAKEHEIVISRGELIEIGGSFRMPDVIAESGATMVEVGTTNRTKIADYAAAITDQTRVLLTSHPSNYRIVGFTAAPGLAELASLARKNDLALVQDLGSGSLVSLDRVGIDEPTVSDCIRAGADVVTFSGDKLLGGPQAGIIVGRSRFIDQIRKHPMARAMRIDKLSLAALTATLKLYRPPHDPLTGVPVLKMITAGKAAIANRAAGLAKQLNSIEGVTAELTNGVSYAGGGSLPMTELASRVIRLQVQGLTATELVSRLRSVEVPVIGRIAKDVLTLDLRTVLRDQARTIVEAVRAASV